MAFDGFNERNIYIHNSNDRNKSFKSFDNSFAKMRADEHKPDIGTANSDKVEVLEEVRGQKENFVIRNNNMMMANRKPIANNPVTNAMRNNMFKH